MMGFRGFLRFGWVGALTVGVLGAAHAQDGVSVSDAEDSANMTREVQLTPQEMAKEATKILGGMDTAQRDVGRMLEEAKEERDVVKVLCLDDKLSQMGIARRAAGERSQSLSDAVGLNDQVTQLSAEANQCIGVEAVFVGDSRVSVDIDPNIPEDPSGYPENPIITVPPGCVSCVL
jgi:hypothetical protein